MVIDHDEVDDDHVDLDHLPEYLSQSDHILTTSPTAFTMQEAEMPNISSSSIGGPEEHE